MNVFPTDASLVDHAWYLLQCVIGRHSLFRAHPVYSVLTQFTLNRSNDVQERSVRQKPIHLTTLAKYINIILAQAQIFLERTFL